MELKAVVALVLKILIMLLMLSLGMRLNYISLIMLWRNPKRLAGSIVAAFIAVPIGVYIIIQSLPLSFPVKVGLWVVSITPGAPMIYSAATRRGLSDPELAASFQVTVALLVIIFAPLWLELVSLLTGVQYGFSPLAVARFVLILQLIPITLGLLIHRFKPDVSERIGKLIGTDGFILLLAAALVIVVIIFPRIFESLAGWQFLATALSALVAILSGHFLTGPNLRSKVTIANANAQRNPGLALAIVGWNLPEQKSSALLVILVYVLTAAVVASIYSRIMSQRAIGIDHVNDST